VSLSVYTFFKIEYWIMAKKISYKVALLSGLVFPGFGYLSIKMYRKAALIIIPSIVFFVGLVQISMMKAHALMDLLIAGKVAPDMLSMLEAMQDISNLNMGWQDYAGYGFMLLWAISVLDGFRMAKAD
jgi:hypothetical protein|tara:strand:- start:671 stop:1054 length:384 start_codon:yes stop_codon:yes gene_type:complete